MILTIAHHKALHARLTTVCTAAAYHLIQQDVPDSEPAWLSNMIHSHRLSPAELQQYPQPYRQGLAFSTVVFQGDRYLPWLRQRLVKARA